MLYTQEVIAKIIKERGGLIGYDFSGARLNGLDFSGVCLVGANFSNAFITDVSFSNANLTHATFQSATLRRCSFKNADLIFTNLSFAEVTYCILDEAFLERTDFHQSNLTGSSLKNLNLQDACLLNITADKTYYQIGIGLESLVYCAENDYVFGRISGKLKEVMEAWERLNSLGQLPKADYCTIVAVLKFFKRKDRPI